MAKPQDGGLVGPTTHAITEASKLPVQRHVVQRLFHGWVAQTEPLLKIVNAQHRLDRKRRPTSLGPGGVRFDDLDQRAPGHHPIHLVEKLALARLLGRQVQAQAELIRGVACLEIMALDHARPGPVLQTIP